MNYHYKIMLDVKKIQQNEEQFYLLLAVRSLSQLQGQFKEYLLRINSLDNNNQCQIDNIFEHNYDYVYKLWPCSNFSRQFVRIQMFEKVGRELVKRGEASRLVVYSQEGEKIQFSGSKQQKNVLMLKFKVNSMSRIQTEINTKQLESLNDKIEQENNKNKKERQLYDSYLQSSNKFIESLSKKKYFNEKGNRQTPKHDYQQDCNNQNRTQKFQCEITQNKKPYHQKQYLSNGKYMQHTQNIKKTQISQSNQLINEFSINIPFKPIIRQNEGIVNEIKKRRNFYSQRNNVMVYLPQKQPQRPIPFVRQDMSLKKDKQQQIEQIKPITLHSHKINKVDLGHSRQYDLSQASQSNVSVIVRTNDFPTKTTNNQRRKKSHSHNKQIKQAYNNNIHILQDVDLGQVFHTKTLKELNEQQQFVRIQLRQTKAYFFKCSCELPKKLLIQYQSERFQGLSQQMVNKLVKWKDKIIIPKAKTTLPLHFKIVSMISFNAVEEGEGNIQIKELIEAKQYKKIYLYKNHIVIGFVQILFKIESYFEKNPTSVSALIIQRERKTLSLPQIIKPYKESKKYEKQYKVQNKNNRLSLINLSISKTQASKHPSKYTDKIKQKKLKVKPKVK